MAKALRYNRGRALWKREGQIIISRFGVPGSMIQIQKIRK